MKSQNQDLKEKIKEIIKHDPFLKSRIPHTWEQIWEEQTDQILALLKEEIKKETEWQCEQTLKRCQRWCEEEKEAEKQKWVKEIDKVYKKEQGIHNWLDLREKLIQKLKK